MELSYSKIKAVFATSAMTLGISLCSGFVSASTVPVCSAAGGCLPDFNVTNGTVSYTTNAGNGSGGVLSITGAKAGNISFALDGVRDYLGAAFAANVYDTGGNYILGDDKIAVNGMDVGATGNGDQSQSEDQLGFGFADDNVVNSFGGTNNIFSLTMDIDANGDVTGGTISLTGSVIDGIHGGSLINGVPAGFSDYAQTEKGIALNGTLLTGIFSGDVLGGIAFDTANNKISLGFTQGQVTGGILNEYSPGFAAIGNLSDLSESLNSANYLDTSWVASTYTLDVVVPVPAAGILFVSSLGVMGLFRLKQRAAA